MDKNSIYIGSEYQFYFKFDQNDVINFAKASGDDNPIHLDDEYAKNTIFKKRILHGFLGGSVFSKVFGTLYPGNGTIYLSQTTKFLKPVFIGDEITANVEVVSVREDKPIVKLRTWVVNQNNECVLDGEAVVLIID